MKVNEDFSAAYHFPPCILAWHFYQRSGAYRTLHFAARLHPLACKSLSVYNITTRPVNMRLHVCRCSMILSPSLDNNNCACALAGEHPDAGARKGGVMTLTPPYCLYPVRPVYLYPVILYFISWSIHMKRIHL